jgi:hypothetical protein
MTIHPQGDRPALSRTERHALIETLYRGETPVAEIAQRTDVCIKTVRNVARRAGLPPRRAPQPQRDAAILSRYCAGEPVAAIARDYGVSTSRVRAFYAYVGCPNRPLTMLNLSESARRRQFPRRPAAEARIFSARIVQALGRHGVVPRKTATLELSREAAERPSVWLGLLDGDGSVGIYGGGRQPRVSFAGTRRLMEQCEGFWRDTLGFDTAGLRRGLIGRASRSSRFTTARRARQRRSCLAPPRSPNGESERI